MQLQPKLKKYRLEKGLTQREIGKMLGIYHHSYATHERAGDIPKKYAVILAEYYGVGVDELYGFIEILDGNDFKEMREKHGYRQSDLMEVLGFIMKNLEQELKKYESMGFDDWQMKEIRFGLKNGFDVGIYAKPEFDWLQMGQIRWGLEQGLDVSIYAKPEFNFEQMGEIR